MAFVASVVWTAREGTEQTLQRAVEQLVPVSRQEPACLPELRRVPGSGAAGTIRILEIYADRAGFGEAHRALDAPTDSSPPYCGS